MPKKTFQDVVPPARSIRNIELPSRRQNAVSMAEQEYTPDDSKKFEKKVHMKRADIRGTASDIKPSILTEPRPDALVHPSHQTGRPYVAYVPPQPSQPPLVPDEPSYTYTYDDEPKKSSRKLLYGAVIVFILAIAFGISALFKSAQITVTPRHETQAVAVSLTAQKDSTTGLAFQVVTVTKDAQTQVSAGGTQQVSTKASGTIVIFNNASAAPQKLIATTRFQTASGLVYRLVSAVTVPGRTTSGGKTIPGSVEATVQADQPGSSYNIQLSDFTLPAFKGTAKFATIYARSKTPMTGGFAGQQKTVASDSMTAASTLLQNQLKSSLIADITSQIPDNFVMYPNAV